MRGFVRVLLMALGLIGVGDTLALSGYSNMNLGIVLPAILGVPLVLIGVFFDPVSLFFQSCALGKAVKWLLICGYGAFAILMGVCTGVICRASRAELPGHADALVVLGCGIRGKRVSLTLAKRLDAAIEYLKDSPDTLIVLSGGRGEGELVSEASAMREYLLARGVDGTSLILEEESQSTYDNFAYSKRLIDERLGTDAEIVFVTSNFHVLRAGRVAAAQGIKAHGLGVPGVGFMAPNDYMREATALVFYWLTGRL